MPILGPSTQPAGLRFSARAMSYPGLDDKIARVDDLDLAGFNVRNVARSLGPIMATNTTTPLGLVGSVATDSHPRLLA